MNAYESGTRKVIPAVLIYAKRDGRILMLHRNARAGDYHEGKWNGLGGKLEPGESPREAAARELEEEAGIKLAHDAFRVAGLLQFPNFKPHRHEDWIVWVLTATVPAGLEPWARGPEGDLRWVPSGELLDLDLWEGDRHFLPLVLEGRPFEGTIWYEGRTVARHAIKPLE